MERCVAHAISKGATSVSLADAHVIAERSLGAPTDIESRLRRISAALSEAGIIVEEDQQRIERRLAVTLRSLDLRPDRANLVLLIAGDVSSLGHGIAEALGKGISGSPDRIISIDLSTLIEPWDLRQLLVPSRGGPIAQGHSLLRLIDAPWSVVLFQNIDACHPHVRTTIARALEVGYFTDMTGRKIYLSDALVIFTAPTLDGERRAALGFSESGVGPALPAASQALGVDMAALLDLVITKVRSGSTPQGTTRRRLFADLTKRYRTRGLDITWDKSLVDWLRAEPQQRRTQAEWDEWVDRTLAAALIPHVPEKRPSTKRVVVKRAGEQLVVEGIRTSRQSRG
jgi:hypothetical protein